jgi:ligand-binding SRPBCC domain-containing protein
MAIYRNVQVQTIPLPLEEAWAFFANPRNLAKLTPEEMQFKHIYEPDAAQVYPGMMLVYSVSPVAGIPMQWVTEITQVEPMSRFVDEQRRGPFGMWHHIHEFKSVSGGTEITDTLYYEMPFWVFGQIAHALFAKKQIEGIFEYRRARLKELFPEV